MNDSLDDGKANTGTFKLIGGVEPMKRAKKSLGIWSGDMAAQIKGFLAEKYLDQNMAQTAENFLHWFTEADLQNCPPQQTHDSQRLRCE